MKQPKYYRCGRTIRDLATGKDTTYESVNLAKKESRRLQLEEDGSLGRGSVRVREKL